MDKRKQKSDKKRKNVNRKTSKDEIEEEENYKPTLHDEFEQYYLEREMKRAIKEAKTMDEMLYNLGLELPPEELN